MTAPALPPDTRPIALVGPTASGKSGVALWLADELARRWQQDTPLEIISVDSALVYRGMDIGTAKPTPAELARVPHHLIDIRDPAQAYSAAEFAADARRLVADIHARGRHVLLVGGTMLYLKALLEPMDDLPPAQPELRAVIDAQARELGWPALHAELAQVDPVTAQRLSPNDSQRIGRALEVYRATGQPLSALHTRTARADADAPPAELPLPVISLEPTDRAWLHQRMAQRFDQMLAQGLLDEVRGLMQRPDLHADLPSMRCVGYRQAWEVLQWIQEQENTENIAVSSKNIHKIRELGVAATRQLAKRQLTWLRSMPGRWVEACDQPDLPQRVLARVCSVWG